MAHYDSQTRTTFTTRQPAWHLTIIHVKDDDEYSITNRCSITLLLLSTFHYSVPMQQTTWLRNSLRPRWYRRPIRYVWNTSRCWTSTSHTHTHIYYRSNIHNKQYICNTHFHFDLKYTARQTRNKSFTTTKNINNNVSWHCITFFSIRSICEYWEIHLGLIYI